MDEIQIRKAFTNYVSQWDWDWHVNLDCFGCHDLNAIIRQSKSWLRKIKKQFPGYTYAGIVFVVRSHSVYPHVHILLKGKPALTGIPEIKRNQLGNTWPYGNVVITTGWTQEKINKYVTNFKNLYPNDMDQSDMDFYRWPLLERWRTNNLAKKKVRSTSKIELTDKTWNVITGCSPVSEACQNCYAKRMSNRLRGRYGYPSDEPFRVTFHPDKLDQPIKWKKPRKIFVCSMGDLFHDDVKTEWLLDIWEIAKSCPQHTFQWLTKRPLNMQRFFETQNLPIFDNLWIGVTAENQKCWDERVPILMKIPAAIRFVSVEPMLGPISTDPVVDWIICGCESGPKARPTNISWFRNLRDRCIKSNTPFFLKQIKVGNDIIHTPHFDGRIWDQYPCE